MRRYSKPSVFVFTLSGDQRQNFKKVPGKYDLIDVAGGGDDDDEEAEAAATKAIEEAASKSANVADKESIVYAPSKLHSATQSLIRLIFDTDMFKDALKIYDIDVKKMPLGKLSKSQIAKGFEILEELEAVMENKKKGSYDDISSQFYTVIPHDFGRQRPRPISSREALQQKYDMLAVSYCVVVHHRSSTLFSLRSWLILNSLRAFRRVKTSQPRRKQREKRDLIRMMSTTVS